MVLGSNPQGWGGGAKHFYFFIKKTPVKERECICTQLQLHCLSRSFDMDRYIHMNEYEQVHACIGKVV